MISYTIDPLMRKNLLEFLKWLEKTTSYELFCKVKFIIDNALENGIITSKEIERIDLILHKKKQDIDATIEPNIDKKNGHIFFSNNFNNLNTCSFISMLSETNDFSFERVFSFHFAHKNKRKHTR